MLKDIQAAMSERGPRKDSDHPAHSRSLIPYLFLLQTSIHKVYSYGPPFWLRQKTTKGTDSGHSLPSSENCHNCKRKVCKRSRILSNALLTAYSYFCTFIESSFVQYIHKTRKWNTLIIFSENKYAILFSRKQSRTLFLCFVTCLFR